ncbi:MAG: HAD-IIA family hydrolase [Candidatus Micrarchaeota archaeon]|nr:HAD-IIA family hydrolase [Candidatus Micrarchaeota archaeon]
MIEAVVFDLDGVVYRGAHAIPGVAAEISRLERKVAVLFLTNNATKSRSDYVRTLARFGIRASADRIMTSAYGTAKLIARKWGKGRRIFVVGEQGLCEELEAEAGARLVEENAEIVVCGLDRKIDYRKITLGIRNLLGGAKFVVANSDPTYPAEDGVCAGSGSISASLAYGAAREPDLVVGKPAPFLMRELLRAWRISPKRAAFVGDRLETDIRMANALGMKSVLVLSGIAKKEDVAKAKRTDRPSVVLKSAAEVGKALGI